MNEPSPKQRQMINLDEFERRLGRPTAPAKGSDDPLAELARLVGSTEDRYKAVFQTRPGAPSSAPPELRRQADWLAPQAGPSAPRAPRLGGDFASIEAGLRGSATPDLRMPPEFRTAQFRAAPPADPEPDPEPDPDLYPESEDWLDAPYVPQAQAHIEPPRSRLPLYATAAIIILGMAGIGASFALKRHSVAPHEIAMIEAAPGPTKIQASDTADAVKPDQDASVLDKTPQPAPVAVVNRSEEPVDLGAGQQAPSGTDQQAPGDQTQLASAAPSGAAVVPVPAPPMGEPQSQAFGLAGMIEPKKVKTVVVRPDGTIVANDAPEQQLPAISPVGALPATPADTPSADEAATPKTMARVVTTPKTMAEAQDTAPADDDAAAQAPSPEANAHSAEAKPVELGATDNDANDAAQQPTAGQPASFAVQLAAPQTEAAARQSMAKLQKEFAGELGDYRLKYHQASVANKTVYRVRVVGLSHEEATTLCQNLQAKGGTCFVIKD
jgi:hypothetical protein